MSLSDYYDILDIEHDATLAQVIQAYRIAIGAFAPGSRATYSMYDDNELEAIREQIELAYKTLSHAERRCAYDVLLKSERDSDAGMDGGKVYYLSGKESPGRHHVSYSGAQMRTIRKSRCISLEQLSGLTGIGARQIQAIEEEDISFFIDPEILAEQLAVYAREIGCDPEHVVDTYPLLARSRSQIR